MDGTFVREEEEKFCMEEMREGVERGCWWCVELHVRLWRPNAMHACVEVEGSVAAHLQGSAQHAS